MKLGEEIYSFNEIKELAYAKDGWSRSLDGPLGDRALCKPSIIGGVVLFTSYIPDGFQCSYGGGSNMYALYYETGSSSMKATFESGTYIDGDGDEKS